MFFSYIDVISWFSSHFVMEMEQDWQNNIWENFYLAKRAGSEVSQQCPGHNSQVTLTVSV